LLRINSVISFFIENLKQKWKVSAINIFARTETNKCFDLMEFLLTILSLIVLTVTKGGRIN
jgi:hypothetical protein